MDDEALARQLQEQFDAEMGGGGLGGGPPPPPTETKKDTPMDDLTYALMLQEDFNNDDADLELAKKLQAQFDKESQPKPIPTPPPPKPYIPPPVFSSYKAASGYSHEFWQAKTVNASAECIKRIRSDLQEMFQHPDPTVHVSPNEDDVTHVDALIIGPDETPYEGGFYHFAMRFPANYPWAPPKVIIVTTDDGNCRFNPNLYADGKVCLSILGTWPGPSWSPVQTCMSVLISIQSLMNKTPYCNEPGCENGNPKDIQQYNDCILHEKIRVAVCGMMENSTCGNLFKEEMQKEFRKRYDSYCQLCRSKLHQDGEPIQDPFGKQRGVYQYQKLLERLEKIHLSLP